MHDFDDERGLWESDEDAVPPVIGRVDPRTGEPLMRYDTAGEVSDPDGKPPAVPAISYDTDDGVSVSVTF
jgi:hypothetical protein